MKELLQKIKDILNDYEVLTRDKVNDFDKLQKEIMEEVKDYFLNN